jgi:type VI secretion system protein ImpA
MSVIDVEKYLSPISADAPAGADVEFDPAYFELEKLAQGTPESVMGDEVKPAEEPEWGEVKKAAAGLFEKTRDLRVTMILATALLKTDGLPGFLDGTLLVKGFVEKLWDQFYPKLDPSDNNDPTIRVNILRGFDGDNSPADLYKLKMRLREAVLTNSRQKIGRFCYRDVQVAKGELPPPAAKEGEAPKAPPDINLINAAFEDTSSEDLQGTQGALNGILEGFSAIDAALGARIGGGVGPDFTSIKDVVKQIRGVIDEQLAKRGLAQAPEAGAESSGGAPTVGAAAKGGGVAVSGEIASRQDVIRLLDKICEYYDRFEPTSPVPIFMQRAKRLVTMNFVDLIKDLAPDAMSKIEVYAGKPPES